MFHKRIRVLHVIDSIGVGGAQSMLLDIPPGIEEVEHFCISLHNEETTNFKNQFLKAFKGNLYFASQRKSMYLTPQPWIRILRLIRTIKPDIIHAHLFFSLLISGFLKLGRFYKLPLLTTLYNLKEQVSLFEYYGTALLKNAVTYYIAVVEQNATELKKAGVNKEKIHSIKLNLVSIPKSFQRQIKDEFKGFPLIVRVARFYKEKGYDELLSILSELKTRARVEFRALLLGDGPEWDRIKKRIRELGLEDNVKLPGVKTDYLDYLYAADVVVCTSLREGFGVANTAALMMGKPFVCFSTGGLTDLKTEGYSHAIQDFSISGFSDSLFQIITDQKEREKAARFCRKYYKSKLNTGSVLNYLDVYNKVAIQV